MSAAVLRLRPRVGRRWAGGAYAGVVGDFHVVAGPLMSEPAPWAAAMAWAETLSINACSDFTLPSLAELRRLDAIFPRLLRREPYWSLTTHPDLPTDALVHHFGAGIEGHWGKRHPAHAVAVRRAPTT